MKNIMHLGCAVGLIASMFFTLSATGCGMVQGLLTTPTPTPTNTPLPTSTSTPTNTATATLIPTSTSTRTLTPSPTITPIPATPTLVSQGMKQITLIFVEGDVSIPGKEIWLSYFDENSRTWVTNKGLTNASGSVLFLVPSGNSGESFTFAAAQSEAEMTEAINTLKSGRGSINPPVGLRIPPDPNQTSLTLKIDIKSKTISNTGRFQTWIPK